MAHRFPIGTQYLDRHGKRADLCTVTEQLTTRNSRGEVVREFYWSTHPMLGAPVTIARGVGALIASRLRDLPGPQRAGAAGRIADELKIPASVREACLSFAVLGLP